MICLSDFSVEKKTERPGIYSTIELVGLKHGVKITKAYITDNEYSLEIKVEYYGSIKTPNLLIFNNDGFWDFEGVTMPLKDTKEMLDIMKKTAEIGRFFMTEANNLI